MQHALEWAQVAEDQPMNWKCKALMQGVFSAVPRGERLNYICQRFVARSLPVQGVVFDEYIDFARQHLDFFCRHGSRPLAEAAFYEFGAGADLRIPLTFRAYGVSHQLLIDIRPLLRPELINS